MGKAALAIAVRPDLMTAFGPVPGLMSPGWQGAGAVLLFAGILLMVLAQLDLGDSWRIGIEEGVRPGLVIGGYVGIRRQVVEEEAYLLRTYGDDYRAYARRVGRFLPGVGRLR